MLVWGMMVVGRTVGGLVHYKVQLPTHRKYAIALTVYIVISMLEGGYLYTPVPVMMAMCLCNGLLGVTSYTIRISATQSYVPDEEKGTVQRGVQYAEHCGEPYRPAGGRRADGGAAAETGADGIHAGDGGCGHRVHRRGTRQRSAPSTTASSEFVCRRGGG